MRYIQFVVTTIQNGEHTEVCWLSSHFMIAEKTMLKFGDRRLVVKSVEVEITEFGAATTMNEAGRVFLRCVEV